MDCNDIQEKLSPYIEGIVSPEEKVLIDEHLKACRKCNTALADLKKALEHIQNLEEMEPPPWLTQKVMARVRAEAEQKRGIFQRLFYPLHIKLPIEAVAAIAVAITTVYVFKAIQPEMKFAKAPLEEVRPRILSEEKEKTLTLDEGKPLSTKPAEQVTIPEQQEFAVSKRAEAPRAPARVTKREKVVPEAGALVEDEAKRKALPSELRRARVKGEKERISLTITVEEITAARNELEKAFMQFGGKIIKTEYFENRNIIVAELDSQKMKGLLEKLELIGETEEKALALEGWEDSVEIRVEILKKP